MAPDDRREPLSGPASLFAWDFDGGRTRARTLDPLIKSQLLYQLSYAPIATVEDGPSATPGM